MSHVSQLMSPWKTSKKGNLLLNVTSHENAALGGGRVWISSNSSLWSQDSESSHGSVKMGIWMHMRNCVDGILDKGTTRTITKHPVFPFVKPQSHVKTFQLICGPQTQFHVTYKFPKLPRVWRLRIIYRFKKDAECIPVPLWSGPKFSAVEGNVGETSWVHLQTVTHRAGCVFGNEVASETHWVHQKVGSPRPGEQETPELSRIITGSLLSSSKWDKRSCD